MLRKTKAVILLAVLLPSILVSCEDTLENIEISDVVQPYEPEQKISYDLLSSPQASIIKGDTARIVIRTIPWNLIESDSCFMLTDTIGLETDECIITDKVMMPDSTWHISIVQKKGSSSWIRICANAGDSIYRTEPVNVTSVTISQYPSILVGGSKVSVGDKTTDYSVVLPAVTDFSNIKMTMVWFGGDSATVNGQLFAGANNMVDFSRPATLTLWKQGASKSYHISVHNTGLPVVRITTPKKSAITSRDIWMANCDMRIELSDGTVNYQDTLSIRCRGNASYTDTEKKSYALKMDEKDKVLGMHKHKRWILLANFKDRTLMRNDVTFWLARHTSQDYVISGQFVELEVNGEYRGNYYLCEQGKIGKHRININDPDPSNPGTSGYLLESDAYFSEEKDKGLIGELGGFISSNMQIPYAFKQPDEEEMTQEAFGKVQKFINDFEACLKNETRVRNHEYEKFIDVDQCIDYAIIQELTGNLDFYNSYPVNGTHSMYFHLDNIDNGGKLVFGHLWDFDYMTFDPGRASGWVGITKHGYDYWSGGSQEFYYYYLFKDSKFTARFKERWNTLKGEFLKAVDYIDNTANVIRLSERCNATMPVKSDGTKGWFPIINKNGGGANSDQSMSFQDAIDSMKKGLVDRWFWMDKAINSSSFPNN